MRNLDHEYLERRRQESLARADLATDSAIALTHRAFAQGYARKLESEQPAKLHIAQPR